MTCSVSITVLIENSSSRDGVFTEHGLAFWIEYDGKHILFDTGQSDAIIENARRMSIDLSRIDAIVLSHGHYDHTGGLVAVPECGSNAQIYLHAKAIEDKYSCKDRTPQYIGMCHESKQQLDEMLRNGKVIYTNDATVVCDGAVITGQVPRINRYEDTGGQFYSDRNCCIIDPLADDQAMFFRSRKGVVVVCGCAHAGIVNTLNYINRLTKQDKIYAVIGGMHLVNAGDERVEKTMAAFEEYGIRKIVPLHCTGYKAVQKMKTLWPKRCLSLGVGGKFCI